MRAFPLLPIVILGLAAKCPGKLVLVAGHAGGLGNADDIGADARFGAPSDVVSDGAGHLYVADSSNSLIRRVELASGRVTTFAGAPGAAGDLDGVGTAARLDGPVALALDGGQLYVAELAAAKIRRIDLTTRQVTTLPIAAGQLTEPRGLALDGAGNLYVSNSDQTLRAVQLSTIAVSVLAGSPGLSGSTDGIGGAARFSSPVGLFADGAGMLYVADDGNGTIRAIDLATANVTTLAGSAGAFGSSNGVGVAARFSRPFALRGDGAGNLFIAEDSNGDIRQLQLASATVSTLAGTAGVIGSADGTGAAAQFDRPGGLVFDGAGALYVADTTNQSIRKIVIATAQVTTPLGAPPAPGSLDGKGAAARFWRPTGITRGERGTAYVADTDNDTIRKIDVGSGQVTTLAGTARANGSSDGIGAAARFTFPNGVVSDRAGLLYVADSFNDSIRQIVVATAAVTTIAGPAGLSRPSGLALDGHGSLFIASTLDHTIVKLDLVTHALVVVAGATGVAGSTDGAGAAARFNRPGGLAADANGHIYIADVANGTIRQLDLQTNIVTTLAGVAGSFGLDDGVGAQARFTQPVDVAQDGDDLFVTDRGAHTVRHIELGSRRVTTVVGTPGRAGFAPGPLPARLGFPTGITVGDGDTLLITNLEENLVARVQRR